MVASPAAAPSPRHLTVPGDTDSSSSSSNDARLTATPSRTPTPSHQLPLSTSRESAYLQSIFIGLAFASSPAKSGTDGHDDLRFFLSVSEGFAIQATEQGRLDDVDLREGQGGAEQAVRTIVEKLRQFAASQSYKIQLVAVAEPGLPTCFLNQAPLLLPTLWAKLDAIPFLIPTDHFAQSSTSPAASPSTSFFPPRAGQPKRRHIDLSFLPAAQTPRAEGDDRAQRAVREAVKALSPTVKSATTVDTDGQTGEVEVDRAGQIQLASLDDYKATTSPDLWDKFLALSRHLNANRIKVSFFSATPQGGGVALMRHALVRLWRLVGVDVKWFCPEGHPAIFDITKQRFHNVLQGVSKPGTTLRPEHKEMFERWTEANLETFWSEGAIDSRIIVIDDPQLCALIPLIRARHPAAKVCFRSHIQIDTALTDDPSPGPNVHRDVWQYLWGFIRQADLFVAHPVKKFVPRSTLESGLPVVYMPPSTDPLDGLNKPIGAADMRYYCRTYFSRISMQQCGVALDWDRPYVIQVARFDPSKGIPVLLEAYRSFRQQLADRETPPALEETPQLIIAGHGSVDDPDGQPIFEEIADILHKPEYEFLRHDVSVVRVPPCDRTLGAILQGAWCATQLSTKEGFEVKVTEAVHKRVPIIISSAGGLPLQVRDGVNGWIVPSGESAPVADRLLALFDAGVCPLPTVGVLERAGQTPNSLADAVVDDLLAHPPRINPTPPASMDGAGERRAAEAAQDDAGQDVGCSEDFFTVGNAVKWMALWARIGPRDVVEAGGLLDGFLGKEGAPTWEGVEGRSVWELVLGEKDDSLVI